VFLLYQIMYNLLILFFCFILIFIFLMFI